MTRYRRVALAALVTALGVIDPSPTPGFAAASCPTVPAVSKAVGAKVTKPDADTCAFQVGTQMVSFEFTPSTNVAADLAARRSDAIRRTAPTTRTKVGPYAAFTGTASGVAQIFYDQKGTVVYVSHQEINARSAEILTKSAAALAKIAIPAKISSCTAITAAVVGAVAGAKAVPTGPGSCQFILADASTVFVGIQSDQSFTDWYATYAITTDRPPVADINVKGRKGFAVVGFGTDVVLPLDTAIATISLNFKSVAPLQKSLPAKAAAAIA